MVRMRVALDSLEAFVQALTIARTIVLGAYFLPPGPVEYALLAAARRGARVGVWLEARPVPDPGGRLRATNDSALATLHGAGAQVHWTTGLHLKAAVVDGRAWLDGRNWVGSGESLVRIVEPAAVRAICAAITGRSARAPAGLTLTKRAALRAERAVVSGAGGREFGASVALASESFGAGIIATTLLAAAQCAVPIRLLVAQREAHARSRRGTCERAILVRLAAAGVAIRCGRSNLKLALAGSRAWIGSANATWARDRFGEQRDWGLTLATPNVVRALGLVFEQAWAAGRPLGLVRQTEEIDRGLVRCADEVRLSEVEQFRHFGGDAFDERRLVALAPIGDRGEIRTVRFENQRGQTDRANRLP